MPDEERDRPVSAPPQLPLGVVAAKRLEIPLPVRAQPLRGIEDLGRRVDADLPGQVAPLIAEDVADDLVTTPPPAAGTLRHLWRYARGDIVEEPPRGLEQPELAVQLVLGHGCLFERGRRE